MIKKKALRTFVLAAFFLALAAISISWVYGNFFLEIDTGEIDLCYELLLKKGTASSDLILDLGVRESSDLQLAVDRIKKAMALKDYDIWLSYHGDSTPPAYIERKGPFLTIYFSTQIEQLREKINVLIHEIGHVYVWGLGGIPSGYDEEKVVDSSGVFLGLGIPVLNGFTDVTSIGGMGEYRKEKKFYGYLTPDEFGYLMARYCAENGVYDGNVSAFLNHSGRKYFSRGRNYLARNNPGLRGEGTKKTGAFWCPECGQFNRIDISSKISVLRCSNCAWEKRPGFSAWDIFMGGRLAEFIHGPLLVKLSKCAEALSTAEINVFRSVNTGLANPVCDSAVKFFTRVPVRYFMIPAVFLFIFSKRKYLKGTALALLASSAVTAFICDFLKETFKRPRPFLSLEDVRLIEGVYPGYSFPSGHAMWAFSVAAVMTVRYPRTGYVFILLAVAVAVSRVYLGLHYPGDVAAGALIGWFCGYAVAVYGFPGETAKKKKQKEK